MSPGLDRDEVLFFDNGHNYLWIEAVCRALRRDHGVSSSVVVLNPKKQIYLERRGLSARFLDLRSPSRSDVETGRAVIDEIERRFPSYRFRLSLRRDRILRWYPRRTREELMAGAAAQLRRLLRTVRPALVVGEISWAVEDLFYHLSEAEGVPYRHLLNLPTSQCRITLFDCAHSAESARSGAPAEVDDSDRSMSYYDLCRKLREFRFRLGEALRRLAVVYSPADYRQSMLYKARRPVAAAYDLLYRGFEKLFAVRPEEVRGGVFFPLHVQPESTPDYVSPFYADQLALIERIADSLPASSHLYVKEHPNLVSFRNLPRLARLLLGPTVRLAPRAMPSADLLTRTDCAATVAGTVAAEAAQAGKPAVVFSGVFLRELPNVVDARDHRDLAEAFAAAASRPLLTTPPEEIQNWLSKLGRPGFVHDPRIVPEVLSPENVADLCSLIVGCLARPDPRAGSGAPVGPV